MVLDATLLNTQHYKVRIKGKGKQSRERSSGLPLYFGVVAIEKGVFGSYTSTVANFTYLSYIASERPSSWARPQRDFFRTPSASITSSTLSGHLAVKFLPDLGFSTFLLRLFIEPVA